MHSPARCGSGEHCSYCSPVSCPSGETALKPNHNTRRIFRPTFIPFGLLLLATGCGDDSARIAGVAHHAIETQSRQNEALVHLSDEVVASSRELVEQDANARSEILEAQRSLQCQQTELGQQRDDLEQERRRLVSQRRAESVFAPILKSFCELLLCLLPLSLAGYALFLTRSSVPEMSEVGEILLHEIVTDSPRLLPLPATSNRRLEQSAGDSRMTNPN